MTATTKYQAVIRARNAATLRVYANIIVFEHADRMRVERIIETGMVAYEPLIAALRLALPNPIISTEMMIGFDPAAA